MSQKRKFDSYQGESAAMAQTVAGPSTSIDLSKPLLLTPNPELQGLYNNWRHVEEKEKMEAHLRGQGQLAPPSNDGNNDRLRPPSPAATTMSRSPSQASTSNSITRDINTMAVSEDKSPNTKRKQGRQGPLDVVDKARTAFIRKLRACEVCRRRKVRCEHFNFRLYEEAYHASKQTVPTPATSTNPNIATQQHDLIGVGVGPNQDIFSHNQSHLQPGSQDASNDFEDLLRQIQVPTHSFVAPNHTGVAPLYNFPPSRARHHSSPPSLLSFDTGEAERHVPIGRLLTPDTSEYDDIRTPGEWECRFGDDGTASSVSVISDDMICKQRCGSLQNLEEHFQTAHEPFENGKIYPFCKECEQHYDTAWSNYPLCPACRNPASTQEQWYFGDLRPTPSATSRPSVKLAAARGDGGELPPPLARNPTITQLSMMFGGAAAAGDASLGGTTSSNFSQYSYYHDWMAGSNGHSYGKRHLSGRDCSQSFVKMSAAGAAAAAAAASASLTPPSKIHLHKSLLWSMSKEDDTACSPFCSTSRGRKRSTSSCPYYAYSKELSLVSSSRGGKSGAPRSISSLRWPMITALSSFFRPGSRPALLRLFFLFFVIFLIARGCLFSHRSTVDVAPRTRARPAGWRYDPFRNSLPQWKMTYSYWLSSSSVPGLNALPITEISAMCILVGAVGMWVVKHVRARLLGSTDGDDMNSHRQLYPQRDQRRYLVHDDAPGVHPQRHDLEGASWLHRYRGYGHEAGWRSFPVQASAAAAG